MEKRAGESRRGSICLVAGYGAMLAVQFALFHGLMPFGSMDANAGVQDSFFVAALVSKAVVLAAIFVLHARWSFPSAATATALAASSSLIGFAIVAMSLRFFSMVPAAELLPWFAAGGACLGCADALALLLWGRAFAAVPSRKTYCFVLAGNLAGLCGYAAIGALLEISLGMLAALFLASMACASIACRGGRPERAAEACEGGGAARRRDGVSEMLRQAASSLWRPALGLALFCFMAGLMTKASGQQSVSFAETQAISIVASAACIAILALPVLLVREPSAVDRMYGLALPLSATGFLLLPVFGSAAPGVVNAFAQCGSMMASMVVWCMAARRSHAAPGNAAALYAGIFGLATFAELCGLAAGGSGLSFFSQEETPSTAVALASLYLLSCCSLFVLRMQGSGSQARPSEGRIEGKAGEPDSSAGPSDRNAACERLACRNRLTPKEAEVLALLAQGRTVRSISERLVVSENTTKSHIKSIYQKLGVHSRSEVLELVDEACACASSGRDGGGDGHGDAGAVSG